MIPHETGQKECQIMSAIWYILVLAVIAVTIAYIAYNYRRIRSMPEGTPEMVEMAGIIRSGANTFMKTEYRTIVIVVAVLAVVFSLFVEKTSGITFLFGALMSSCACVLGMRSATYANVRTSKEKTPVLREQPTRRGKAFPSGKPSR